MNEASIRMHGKTQLIFQHMLSRATSGAEALCDGAGGCSLGRGWSASSVRPLSLKLLSARSTSSFPICFQFCHFSSVQNSDDSLLECHYSVQVSSLDLMLVGSNEGSEGQLARSNEELPGV